MTTINKVNQSVEHYGELVVRRGTINSQKLTQNLRDKGNTLNKKLRQRKKGPHKNFFLWVLKMRKRRTL